MVCGTKCVKPRQDYDVLRQIKPGTFLTLASPGCKKISLVEPVTYLLIGSMYMWLCVRLSVGVSSIIEKGATHNKCVYTSGPSRCHIHHCCPLSFELVTTFKLNSLVHIQSECVYQNSFSSPSF